jgi:hypothetical protein
MGAHQSRSQQGDGDDSQDYYAILQVEENASADEIRVSLHFEEGGLYSAMQ